ncbi:MAG: ribosomal-processing cysteine protease Prp [Schwartzia sp.]|nr:ribosomal-processing cysteine protease Prp [Schwartzia sp. (in: firmicutes)]
MIEVEIYEEKDGRISAFSVRGHSGTAPKGRDIVCAGVSALAQTALLGLGRHLHRELDYHIDPSGDLHMKLMEAPDDFTETVLRTMRMGIEEIERVYPDAVRTRILNGISGR